MNSLNSLPIESLREEEKQILSQMAEANKMGDNPKLYELKNVFITQKIEQCKTTLLPLIKRHFVHKQEEMNTIELKIDKLYSKAKVRANNVVLFKLSDVNNDLDNDLSDYINLTETINVYIKIINNSFNPSEKVHLDKENSKTEVRGENLCDAPNCTLISSKICGQCKKARYCSVECQKKDWSKHKIICLKHNNN